MFSRLVWLLPLALLAACGGLSPGGGGPVASGGGSVDPSRAVAQPNTTSTNTTGTDAGTTRSAKTTDSVVNRPKQLEYADVTCNPKTGEGARFLTHYLLSSEWIFWKKAANPNGTVIWTFARPNQGGVDVVKIRELNNP